MIKVFSTQWFSKYQSLIVRVARLPILGDLIFNFKKFGHFVDRKNIVEVTPNSVVEFIGYKKGKVELKQYFFVRNEYALRLQHVFYPIWITFHIWDIITRPIPQLNLGFDTLTVYPDASSGGTTVDGYVFTSGINRTFAQILSDNGSGQGKTQTGSYLYSIRSSTTINTFTSNFRSIYTFDTHTITSDAIISSVIFSLWGTFKVANLGKDYLHIVASTPANNNDLVNDDYAQLGSTSFGSIAYDDFVSNDSQYNDITLNAAGKSATAKGAGAITKLGVKGGWDLSGTFGGAWASNVYTDFQGYYSDNGSNKPKLVVTYTTVVGPANLKTYNTNLAANIKTINTNAIANVKSLDTNV